MTVAWRNNVQIPSLGTAVTSANTGDGTHDAIASTSATGSGNTFVSDNGVTFGTDTLSWLMTQGGANLNIQYINLASALSRFVSMRPVNIAGTPTSSVTILRQYTDTTHATIAFNVQYTTTRKLSLTENGQTGVTSTAAIAANTKIYLIFDYNQATSTATVTAYAYGTTTVLATATVTVVGSYNIISERFGIAQASSGIGNVTWGRTQVGDGAMVREDVTLPPTAAYTHSETGLTTSVDGSTSTPVSPATISSYSWNWGDGSAAGSGATASHTYRVKGTYTATLTVTDSNGQTGNVSHSITVTSTGVQIIKSNTAEGGTSGTTIGIGNTGGASGDAFDTVSIGASNTATFDNGWSLNGTLSYLLTQAGANQNIHGWTWGQPVTDFAIRSGFRMPALPAVTGVLFRAYSDAGYVTQVFGVSITATGKLQVTDTLASTTVTGTVSLAANTDYVAAIRWISSTTVVFKVFAKGSTTPIDTVSFTASAASIQSMRWGITTASSFASARFDDLAVGYDGDLPRTDATNTIPIAVAGPDQTGVEPYALVTLDGSGSTDPDGTIAGYLWTPPAGVTLSSNTAVAPTFFAPATLAGTTLTFSLVVTDNLGATSPADTVDIVVVPHTIWRLDAGAPVPVRLIRL